MRCRVNYDCVITYRKLKNTPSKGTRKTPKTKRHQEKTHQRTNVLMVIKTVSILPHEIHYYYQIWRCCAEWWDAHSGKTTLENAELLSCTSASDVAGMYHQWTILARQQHTLGPSIATSMIRLKLPVALSPFFMSTMRTFHHFQSSLIWAHFV